MLIPAPGGPVWVGIDVAKSSLDVCILPQNLKQRILNQPEAINSLASHLAELGPHVGVVLEASGGYEADVHQRLTEAGFPTAIINARWVRDFARAKGYLAKTDRIDARILASYGQHFQPQATSVKCRDRAALAEVLAYRDHLNAEITVIRQQLAQI